jgi:hypothetical protein
MSILNVNIKTASSGLNVTTTSTILAKESDRVVLQLKTAKPVLIVSAKQGPSGRAFDPEYPQPQLPLEYGNFSSKLFTSNTTGEAVLDTFQHTEFGVAKYIIYATSFGRRQVCELLILHDGETIHSTEYAMMATDEPLGQYHFEIQDNTMKLIVDCPFANITYKVIRTLITN